MSQSTTNVNASTRRPVTASRTGPFRLARVEKTDNPDGGRGGQHWYRYVLDNGRSTITGQRRGSLKDVTAHANRYAEQLNTRTFGSHSVWTARRGDAKPKAAK
ncbi:MAG: hypothetical protein HY308_05140 [Gammaproteobacteria bacterium]|nr:hypothetical protein [Gammaproteobacteria bacterium]